MLTLGIGVAAALLWGVHDLCVRRLSREVDVPAAMLVVLLVGAACLLPLILLSGDVGVPAGRGLALTVLAGALFATATGCLWRAFGSGPVRVVAPITAAYPVASLSLAVVAGEPVGALAWAAVAVVVAGVAIVASSEGERDEAYSLRAAVAWSVATAVAFALTFALGQRIMAEQAAVPTLLVTRLAAAGVVVAVMLATGGPRWPGRGALPMLAAMGALDAGALGLVLWAGRFDDASYATVTASLFGVVTILLAATFLGERLLARQWLGVGVAFAAIAALGATVE